MARELVVIAFLLALTTTSSPATIVNASRIHPDSAVVINDMSWGKCVQTSISGIMGCGIFPTDTSFVDNLIPSQPMEQQISRVLIVQDTPSVPVSKNYAFLKFNISNVIPKSIFTSHARPLNASLWLYAQFATGFVNASVRVYHVVGNDWNESTLTWNNMPPLDTTHFEANQIRAINRWYRWNVTTDVANDIEGNETSSFALLAGFTSWNNYAWFTSRENVTYPPELDVYFREPTLTLTTPFPNLPITVDGETRQTDSTGALRVQLPWGPHSIAAPDIIPGESGVRELFVGWSDNVSSAAREINIGNNVTLQANYMKQYRLDVSSPYATANGAGWYFANEIANVSVEPAWVFSGGLLGLLGVRQVFDHWTGACTTSQPECALAMNGPRETSAVWRQDYTAPIGVSAIVVVVIAFLWLRRRNKSTRRARKKV